MACEGVCVCVWGGNCSSLCHLHQTRQRSVGEWGGGGELKLALCATCTRLDRGVWRAGGGDGGDCS